MKYRFVRTVQAYFSMGLSKPGEALQADFDFELKQVISHMLEKRSSNQAGVQ